MIRFVVFGLYISNVCYQAQLPPTASPPPPPSAAAAAPTNLSPIAMPAALQSQPLSSQDARQGPYAQVRGFSLSLNVDRETLRSCVSVSRYVSCFINLQQLLMTPRQIKSLLSD